MPVPMAPADPAPVQPAMCPAPAEKDPALVQPAMPPPPAEEDRKQVEEVISALLVGCNEEELREALLAAVPLRHVPAIASEMAEAYANRVSGT